MKLTESKLRQIIRSVIREEMINESKVNEAQVNNYYSFNSLEDFRKASGVLRKAGFYRSGNANPPTGDELGHYREDERWRVITIGRGQKEAAKLLKNAKLDKGGKYQKPMDYKIFNQGGYLD